MKNFQYDIVYQDPEELDNEIMSQFESRVGDYKIKIF
jgi:hypothetical protein